MAERIADQLATICAMLGEYPAVRYRRCLLIMCGWVEGYYDVIGAVSPVMLLTLLKQYKFDWMPTKQIKGTLDL